MLKGNKARALLAVGALLAAGPVIAAGAAPEQKGTNRAAAAGKESEQSQAVSQRVLAYQLANWGKANNDPQALILAAKMLNNAPASDNGPQGTNQPQKGAPAAGQPPASTKPAITTASLLGEARTMANGDRYVLQQASLVEGSASKGVVDGPFDYYRDIAARTVYSIDFTARAGEVLRVGAAGDGDTDVDIRLIDGNGNVVCQDLDRDPWGVCAVTPAWTGRFRLQVINNGNVWTRTHIVTN